MASLELEGETTAAHQSPASGDIDIYGDSTSSATKPTPKIRWFDGTEQAIGTVTSVTGTAPISVTAGATPVVSIAAASGSVPGSMSAADFTKLAGVANGATAFAALTGNVTTGAGGGAATIAASAVTLAMMANLTPPTFIGRKTASVGVPEALTIAQAKAMLGLTGAWVNVVDDYLADNTGSIDATSAFQAANDALATTGGIIFIPAGTYKLNTSAAVLATSNNVNWKGANRRATVLACNHASLNMFTVSGDGVRIEDVRFSTVGSSTTLRTGGYAIEMQNSGDSSGVLNCDILFQWSCIRSSGPLQFVDGCNIREYGANAAAGACILVDGGGVNNGGDRYIRNVTTDNGSNPTGFAGVRVNNCASLTMTSCNWIHCTTCLALEPLTGATVPSIEVVNSFFDSSVKGMAITPAGTGAVYRSKFTNCWFGSNSTAGVEMNGTQWDGITFVNCDFYGAGSPAGIGISCPTGGGIWHAGGCRFAGLTTAISVAASAAHHIKITDCFIGAQSAFPANTNGITIGAGVYKGIQIMGCSLTDNFTNNATNPAAADGKYYRITDNGGINPRSTSVAPAVPATTVAATNVSGYRVTCYFKGGTVTVITVNGVATGQTVAPAANTVLPIRLEPGATIAATFTVAPTWIWISD